MKKLIAMSFLVLILLASVGGGTWAWFQDTETSANNSLTAGTLDLTVNGSNTGVATVSISNLAPGMSGNGTGILANTGTITGELDISTANMTNVGGSGGTEFEDGNGVLGYYAKMAVFLDVDQSGDWTSGDIGLHYQGTTYNYPTALQYAKVNWYNAKGWIDVTNMAGGASVDLVVVWMLESTVGNEVQGDAVTLDFNFLLEQVDAD